jgi:hypothetical protein
MTMTRTSTLDACYVRVRQKQELGGNFLPPLEPNAPRMPLRNRKEELPFVVCFVFVLNAL